MGISTEQFIVNLPPKEPRVGVDWLSILDSFDPSKLEQRFLNECARRNPYQTCYHWDTPSSPVEERLMIAESCAKRDRRKLQDCIARIETEGVTPLTYKQARAALIAAIGTKGALEYVKQEYQRLGPEDRKNQIEEYLDWEDEWKLEQTARKAEYDPYNQTASVHEKVLRIRKGIKGSNGKCLIQRDFAKFLEYPVNKYAEAEKVDRYGINYEPETPVETELLEKLVLRAHANPYWLFDNDCEAFLGEIDPSADAVIWKDEPCIYATPDIILRWIREGKPKETNWVDGI